MTFPISPTTHLHQPLPTPPAELSAGRDQVSSKAEDLADIAKDLAVAASASGSSGAAISLLTRGVATHLAFEAGYAAGGFIDSLITEQLGQPLGAAVYDWTHPTHD